MACRACLQDHQPMELCSVWKRQRAAINSPAINADAINGETHEVRPIDSAGKESGAGRSSNGRAKADYNAYMRVYMKKRRAK